MIAVAICETSVTLDRYNREVCVGTRCMRYETEEQFKMAYELVMEIARFCDVKAVNERMMEALRSRAYRGEA